MELGNENIETVEAEVVNEKKSSAFINFLEWVMLTSTILLAWDKLKNK